MASAPTELARVESPSPAPRRPRRLVFDRRYGWIVDEWADPWEEALAGGRGMFCILPIARGAAKMALRSVDIAAQSVAKILEDPSQFSFQSIKVNLTEEFQKLMHLAEMSKVKLFGHENDSNKLPSPS